MLRFTGLLASAGLATAAVILAVRLRSGLRLRPASRPGLPHPAAAARAVTMERPGAGDINSNECEHVLRKEEVLEKLEASTVNSPIDMPIATIDIQDDYGVQVETRSRHQIPWNWSYRGLLTIMRTEPRSFGRTANAFNHGGTSSPAPILLQF